MTRIALIHATTLAMAPIASVFANDWPDAQLLNLLDDALPADRAKSDALSPDLYDRFAQLAHYAQTAGADAILVTCSAFGPAIEAARAGTTLPMLKPNEAMFAEALQRGSRIGMVATFEPAVDSMRTELLALADAAQRAIEIEIRCSSEALRALVRGDVPRHDELVVEAARELSGCDVIMLAQFSMARARAAVQHATGIPVLTSPDCAVRALKQALDRNKLV